MDLTQKLSKFNAMYARRIFVDPEEKRFYEFKDGREGAFPIRIPDPAPATLHDALLLMVNTPKAETDLEQGLTDEERYLRNLIIGYTTDLYDPETAKDILKKTYNIEWWIQETTLKFQPKPPKRS